MGSGEEKIGEVADVVDKCNLAIVFKHSVYLCEDLSPIMAQVPQDEGTCDCIKRTFWKVQVAGIHIQEMDLILYFFDRRISLGPFPGMP